MAKFCTYCGKEVSDQAVICTGCGCMIRNTINSFTPCTEPTNNHNTSTSLILGIFGIVFAWLFALVGHITSIIGIVLGVKEYKETNKMTGLTLSIVGEVCSILSSIIGAVTMATLF